MRLSTTILAVFLLLLSPTQINAQTINEDQYDALEYRLVGPFRGGRSAAVTGVPNQPNLFYFGATGGGIWKTTDGGKNWVKINKGLPEPNHRGRIGIDISPTNPKVLYILLDNYEIAYEAKKGETDV